MQPAAPDGPSTGAAQEKPGGGAKARRVQGWEPPAPPFPCGVLPPVPSQQQPCWKVAKGCVRGPAALRRGGGAPGSSPPYSTAGLLLVRERETQVSPTPSTQGGQGRQAGAHCLVLSGRASQRPSEERERFLWLNGCSQIYSGC